MPTANDLAAQKRQIEDQKRATDVLISQQKDALRKQITDFDKQISDLQALKSKAQAELSKLG